jgi:hypothetical protein
MIHVSGFGGEDFGVRDLDVMFPVKVVHDVFLNLSTQKA